MPQSHSSGGFLQMDETGNTLISGRCASSEVAFCKSIQLEIEVLGRSAPCFVHALRDEQKANVIEFQAAIEDRLPVD